MRDKVETFGLGFKINNELHQGRWCKDIHNSQDTTVLQLFIEDDISKAKRDYISALIANYNLTNYNTTIYNDNITYNENSTQNINNIDDTPPALSTTQQN